MIIGDFRGTWMSLTPGAMLPNGFTMTLIIPISDGGLIVCENFMKVIWEKNLRDEISAIKRSKKCCLFWHYPLKGLFVATLFIESTNTWHYALCTKSIGTWYYSLLSMLNKIYIYTSLYKHVRACTNFREIYGKWACSCGVNVTQ